MAGLFQVLYGRPDGTFRKAELLNGSDGEPLIIPIKDKSEQTENICTRPFAVDWDGDGRLDLIVGNFSGSFYWFHGEGNGKFRPKPEALRCGNGPLLVEGHHSDPFVIDWDADGDLDLVSGSASGGIQWAENIAAKGKLPELRPFRVLIKPEGSDDFSYREEDELTGPVHAMRVWVADVSGDGKLDLLVGDSVTLVSPANGIGAQEFKKKLAAWREAVTTASNNLSAAAGDEIKPAGATEALRNLYLQKDQFMHEEMTGFVWLYVKK